MYVEVVEQAIALLKPRRIELLKCLGVPRTCPELAAEFGESAQNIYYHVKARVYWLAPPLVGQIRGPRATQDQVSPRTLLSLAEGVQADVGRLAQQVEAGQAIPSLSLSAQIYLPGGDRRAAFLRDVQATFERLAQVYGRPADEATTPAALAQDFRLALACYPQRP